MEGFAMDFDLCLAHWQSNLSDQPEMTGREKFEHILSQYGEHQWKKDVPPMSSDTTIYTVSKPEESDDDSDDDDDSVVFIIERTSADQPQPDASRPPNPLTLDDMVSNSSSAIRKVIPMRQPRRGHVDVMDGQYKEDLLNGVILLPRDPLSQIDLQRKEYRTEIREKLEAILRNVGDRDELKSMDVLLFAQASEKGKWDAFNKIDNDEFTYKSAMRNLITDLSWMDFEWLFNGGDERFASLFYEDFAGRDNYIKRDGNQSDMTGGDVSSLYPIGWQSPPYQEADNDLQNPNTFDLADDNHYQYDQGSAVGENDGIVGNDTVQQSERSQVNWTFGGDGRDQTDLNDFESPASPSTSQKGPENAINVRADEPTYAFWSNYPEDDGKPTDVQEPENKPIATQDNTCLSTHFLEDSDDIDIQETNATVVPPAIPQLGYSMPQMSFTGFNLNFSTTNPFRPVKAPSDPVEYDATQDAMDMSDIMQDAPPPAPAQTTGLFGQQISAAPVPLQPSSNPFGTVFGAQGNAVPFHFHKPPVNPFKDKPFCCTLTGLSLHSLILHIYIASFVHSYSINSVLHSPSISHT